ncbi:MAG TPA: DUF4031 domain-containing protein [Acidimicrobiales bacterium]|nr:DUF4031 domain-containing protein [Acidimicrobiales bacterium]
MTILVDSAIWPWRGKNWAHLISDETYIELHNFAEKIGLRRMSFQGDHYDINAQIRDIAIKNGAKPVDGRELITKLKEAGLRLPPAQRLGQWEKINGNPPKIFDKQLSQIQLDWKVVTIETFRRSIELAIVIECSTGIKLEDKDRIEDMEIRITNNNCRLELLLETTGYSP